MLTFNWGIFWALLAAFAVRGYYRFLIHRTKTGPDLSALQLLWAAVYPVVLILVVVYRSVPLRLALSAWAALSANGWDNVPSAIVGGVIALILIVVVAGLARKDWHELGHPGEAGRDRMKNYPHVAVAFLLLFLLAAFSTQAQTKDLYSNTGKIVRTTIAHSTFDVQNSETKQTISLDRYEPVMFLQTDTETLELHDVARRRFHPLPAGTTWHFRLSSNGLVCMTGVPGKKPKEEQCYLIEGREVRPAVGESAPAVQAGAGSDSISAAATLLVISVPDGAEVYSDGSFVGNAPATLKLAAGKHTLRVTKSAFKDWSRDISVQAGAELRLNAELEKRDQ